MEDMKSTHERPSKRPELENNFKCSQIGIKDQESKCILQSLVLSFQIVFILVQSSSIKIQFTILVSAHFLVYISQIT